jgi:hypothetical protein
MQSKPPSLAQEHREEETRCGSVSKERPRMGAAEEKVPHMEDGGRMVILVSLHDRRLLVLQDASFAKPLSFRSFFSFYI